MGFEYKALIEWSKYMVFCCVSLKQNSFGSSFEFSLAAIYVAKKKKKEKNEKRSILFECHEYYRVRYEVIRDAEFMKRIMISNIP